MMYSKMIEELDRRERERQSERRSNFAFGFTAGVVVAVVVATVALVVRITSGFSEATNARQLRITFTPN